MRGVTETRVCLEGVKAGGTGFGILSFHEQVLTQPIGTLVDEYALGTGEIRASFARDTRDETKTGENGFWYNNLLGDLVQLDARDLSVKTTIDVKSVLGLSGGVHRLGVQTITKLANDDPAMIIELIRLQMTPNSWVGLINLEDSTEVWKLVLPGQETLTQFPILHPSGTDPRILFSLARQGGARVIE